MSAFKPPKPFVYEGRHDAAELDRWIDGIRRYMSGCNVREDEYVSKASLYLRTEAAYWYDMWIPDNLGATWAQFTTALRGRFYPPNYQRDLLDKFYNISQTGSVSDYSHRFLTLLAKLPSRDPVDTLERYINGLKPLVRLFVRMNPPTNFEEALSRAKYADDETFRNPFFMKQFAKRTPAHHSHGGEAMDVDSVQIEERFKGPLTPELKELLKKENRCFYCRIQGHSIRNCRKKAKNKPGQH